MSVSPSLGDILEQELNQPTQETAQPTVEWSRQLISIIQYLSKIIAEATHLKSAEIADGEAEAWVTALKPLESDIAESLSNNYKYMPLAIVSLAYVSRILKEWNDKRQLLKSESFSLVNANKEVGKSSDFGHVGLRKNHANERTDSKDTVQNERSGPSGPSSPNTEAKSDKGEM